MTEREALKLALEALEKYAHDFGSSDLSVKAMYVVRQALAQPKQERVEWGVDWNKDGSCVSIIKRTPNGGIEVVAVEYGPQRTWVGLTDEEIKDCFKITPDQHLPWHIYQRIEAKLKEKNYEGED